MESGDGNTGKKTLSYPLFTLALRDLDTYLTNIEKFIYLLVKYDLVFTGTEVIFV